MVIIKLLYSIWSNACNYCSFWNRFSWYWITQIPRKWTHHVTTLLFFGFGLWSIWDAFTNEGYLIHIFSCLLFYEWIWLVVCNIKFCLFWVYLGLPNREAEELAEVEAKLVGGFFFFNYNYNYFLILPKAHVTFNFNASWLYFCGVHRMLIWRLKKEPPSWIARYAQDWLHWMTNYLYALWLSLSHYMHMHAHILSVD